MRNIYLACCAAASVASAAEVWAPGVSRDGGWVDYNKSAADSKYGTVMGMCWAASASNVISWWNYHNSDSVTSAAPDNPWLVYQAICHDVGGVPSTAFNHWINGIKPTYVEEYYDETNKTWVSGYDKWPDYIDLSFESQNKGEDGGILSSWYEGGFLKGSYDTSVTSINVANKTSHATGYAFAAAIIEALSNGYAISLSTYTYVGSLDNKPTGAHAYTLWGASYSYDEAGNCIIDTAWLTDSDDGETKLVQETIKTAPEGMTLSNGFIVEYADGMRSTRVIPEPATATLGLMALAGLAARRRRK